MHEQKTALTFAKQRQYYSSNVIFGQKEREVFINSLYT